MKRLRIGIVGSGAMAVYTVKWLTKEKTLYDVAVFEAAEIAGTGMPYRSGMNADYMLCNAFSREIPPVTDPLINWLEGQSPRELNEWELSRHDLSARAFYPRTLIGEYLESGFSDLCVKARKAGHKVEVHTNRRVTDIRPDANGTILVWQQGGKPREQQFDVVIIATGHSWPESPKIDDVALLSPWPYSKIEELPPGNIGILGSSLSAIDVVVALGHAHGEFKEHSNHVAWHPNGEKSDLLITMVSHMGVMPEGDFYYPFPYEPLRRLTEEAVSAEIDKGSSGLLDRTFALLCDELRSADPEYLQLLGDKARTVEGFAPAYFSHRQELGGLAAVKRNLSEMRASMKNRETVPHRYMLLRGHEVFGSILRFLDDDDYQRFTDNLMPVFGDCYAAVPHLSLARIVALYDAGVLELLATAEGAQFARTADGAVTVETLDGVRRFDTMIDARGQSAASLSKLPFPSLTAVLSPKDEPIIEPFRLGLEKDLPAQIYCLALPQILQRYPFSQGLADCEELAKRVVVDLTGISR